MKALWKARKLRDQIALSWSPPATTGNETPDQIAQSSVMIALEYIFGPGFVSPQTVNQVSTINKGVELMERFLERNSNMSGQAAGGYFAMSKKKSKPANVAGAFVSCPGCGKRQPKIGGNDVIYYCDTCRCQFDSEPDEGGTHSDRNPAARLEREERERERRQQANARSHNAQRILRGPR